MPLQLLLMLLGGMLVKCLRLALLDGQSPLGADGKARSQAVAEAIADHAGLSAQKLDGSLGAGGDALPAAVAQGFVDLDDLSHDCRIRMLALNSLGISIDLGSSSLDSSLLLVF
jgi:hypothetical protein